MDKSLFENMSASEAHALGVALEKLVDKICSDETVPVEKKIDFMIASAWRNIVDTAGDLVKCSRKLDLQQKKELHEYMTFVLQGLKQYEATPNQK